MVELTREAIDETISGIRFSIKQEFVEGKNIVKSLSDVEYGFEQHLVAQERIITSLDHLLSGPQRDTIRKALRSLDSNFREVKSIVKREVQLGHTVDSGTPRLNRAIKKIDEDFEKSLQKYYDLTSPTPWSRADRIAAVGVLVAIGAAIAAYIAVPSENWLSLLHYLKLH